MLRYVLRPLSLLLLVLALSTPADAQIDLARLDTLLTRYNEFCQFNGAALAARGDEILFAKGYGEANMEWGIPNTVDTRFRIGASYTVNW